MLQEICKSLITSVLPYNDLSLALRARSLFDNQIHSPQVEFFKYVGLKILHRETDPIQTCLLKTLEYHKEDIVKEASGLIGFEEAKRTPFPTTKTPHNTRPLGVVDLKEEIFELSKRKLSNPIQTSSMSITNSTSTIYNTKHTETTAEDYKYTAFLNEKGQLADMAPYYEGKRIRNDPPLYSVSVTFYGCTESAVARTKRGAKHSASKRLCERLDFEP
jgi:hypothetical protein